MSSANGWPPPSPLILPRPPTKYRPWMLVSPGPALGDPAPVDERRRDLAARGGADGEVAVVENDQLADPGSEVVPLEHEGGAEVGEDAGLTAQPCLAVHVDEVPRGQAQVARAADVEQALVADLQDAGRSGVRRAVRARGQHRASPRAGRVDVELPDHVQTAGTAEGGPVHVDERAPLGDRADRRLVAPHEHRGARLQAERGVPTELQDLQVDARRRLVDDHGGARGDAGVVLGGEARDHTFRPVRGVRPGARTAQPAVLVEPAVAPPAPGRDRARARGREGHAHRDHDGEGGEQDGETLTSHRDPLPHRDDVAFAP